MTEIKIDHIVANLTQEQTFKLAEFQAKVVHIQRLPSFDHEVLNDPKYHSCPNTLLKATTEQTQGDGASSTAPLQWDASVIKSKNFIKSVGDLTPKTLRAGMWKNVIHDDPDTLVVRHLQARNWDVDTSLLMMLNSVRWRIEMHVFDDLIAGGDLKVKETAEHGTGEEQKVAAEVMAQLRIGKSFTNGVDRKGRPLLFTQVCKHDPKAQGVDGMLRATVLQSESARMLMRPPVTTSAMIFDLGGFSMANMDWNAVKLITAGLEDKYPESMGVTYVYRAPWIVSGIWSVVKTWMPGTEAQKVTFVSNAQQLSEFVDLKYVPADMGGTGDFEFKYSEPVAGENDLMKDSARRDELLADRQRLIDDYESLTIEWFDLLQLEASREGLYSVKRLDDNTIGNAIEKARSSTAEEAMKRKQEQMAKLRENYWVVDPYVRGKCHGDRVGIPAVDHYATIESA